LGLGSGSSFLGLVEVGLGLGLKLGRNATIRSLNPIRDGKAVNSSQTRQRRQGKSRQNKTNRQAQNKKTFIIIMHYLSYGVSSSYCRNIDMMKGNKGSKRHREIELEL
jgi:hypothetical protein